MHQPNWRIPSANSCPIITEKRCVARTKGRSSRVLTHIHKPTSSETPRHVQVRFQKKPHRNKPRATLNRQRCSTSKNKPGEFHHSCSCSAAPAPSSVPSHRGPSQLRRSAHRIQLRKNSFRRRQRFAAPRAVARTRQ